MQDCTITVYSFANFDVIFNTKEYPTMSGTVPVSSTGASQVPKYTTRPVTIEALRFAGPNAHDAYLWAESHIGSVDPDSADMGVTINPADGAFIIRTLEGDMKVSEGDWVIRGTEGEFYPCKDSVFQRKYEPADERPGVHAARTLISGAHPHILVQDGKALG